MFSKSLFHCIIAMSKRIFQLIFQNDLSAEKQQEIVLKIASASKAELDYKEVSPKQQHLSLFIVFDLVLIASFHSFIFFTLLGLVFHLQWSHHWFFNTHLPHCGCSSWICLHYDRPAEEGGRHQLARPRGMYGFIDFRVFGVECCCVGGVGRYCSSCGSL